MLNRTLSILLVALVALGVFAAPGQAQNRVPEIKRMLEQRDRQIKTILGDKTTFTADQRARLQDLINGLIDFEAMGRNALGPYWRELTPAQRTEFVDDFSEIVRAQSLSDLDVYRASVAYDRITADGDSAFVRTKTVYKNVPATVEYVLSFRDGAWRAVDIILDGVSTAEGYARSFQTAIRKRGYDAFKQSLEKKLARLNG